MLVRSSDPVNHVVGYIGLTVGHAEPTWKRVAPIQNHLGLCWPHLSPGHAGQCWANVAATCGGRVKDRKVNVGWNRTWLGKGRKWNDRSHLGGDTRTWGAFLSFAADCGCSGGRTCKTDRDHGVTGNHDIVNAGNLSWTSISTLSPKVGKCRGHKVMQLKTLDSSMKINSIIRWVKVKLACNVEICNVGTLDCYVAQRNLQ